MKHSLLVFWVLLLMTAGTIAQEDRIQVVASHSILGDVVMMVAGDSADVSVTMPVGADPHAFEAVPSDLVALANADVVFVNGAFFEEGLLEAIENADTDMNIIEASACVEVISFEERDDDHSDEEHDDDHSDEEHDDDHSDEEHDEHCEDYTTELSDLGYVSTVMETMGYLSEAECEGGHSDNDDHSDEEHDEHAHGACDPHVWMNPYNVMVWTLQIRDTLSELDPTNAATYQANASQYLEELAVLADFIQQAVDTVPEENRVLVTSHDSLGYFAATYGFEIVTTIIPGGSTVAEPSASDIVEIITLVNEQGVPAIFGESTVSDAVVQTIADETGVTLYILYSGSLSDADNPANTYLSYMRYNVSTIVEALGGSV